MCLREAPANVPLLLDVNTPLINLADVLTTCQEKIFPFLLMSVTTIFRGGFLRLGALQQKPEVVQGGHSKTPCWQYLLFSLST